LLFQQKQDDLSGLGIERRQLSFDGNYSAALVAKMARNHGKHIDQLRNHLLELYSFVKMNVSHITSIIKGALISKIKLILFHLLHLIPYLNLLFWR
jgi:hypothetical protein